MAPELMRKGRKLRLASDVWSFGVMLVSMFADLVEGESVRVVAFVSHVVEAGKQMC
jgi:serine/threonine protein kinase